MARIVLLSDTHALYRKLSIPDGDILIHAGDATRTGSYNEIRAFGKWLRAQPHALKIFVAGNHDRGFQQFPDSARRALGDEQDGLVYLQDSGTTYASMTFWGSPWQPSFNDWAFNLPRGSSELAERWELIPKSTDVLITHSPPWGILDNSNGEHLGCELLTERVVALQPRLHVFGHIHEGAGTFERNGTRHVNASICDAEYRTTNHVQVIDLE